MHTTSAHKRVFDFIACSSSGGAAEPQQQRGSWLTGGWLRLPGSDPSDAGAGGAGRGGSGGSSGGGLFGLGGSHGTAGAPFAGRGRTIGGRQTEMIGAALTHTTVTLCSCAISDEQFSRMFLGLPSCRRNTYTCLELHRCRGYRQGAAAGRASIRRQCRAQRCATPTAAANVSRRTQHRWRSQCRQYSRCSEPLFCVKVSNCI